MSYESKMLSDLKMPSRVEVEKALLLSLFKRNGIIKEFSAGQEIVEEIANYFNLTDVQRQAYLETIYRKENRLKKSYLWNRLLFRAADDLANKGLISRPTQTFKLNHRREWMLTEKGFGLVLKSLQLPLDEKLQLTTKTFEVQQIVKELEKTPRPVNYDPFDSQKKTVRITKEQILRVRGFRQAVIESYNFRCSFCGMKINSPDNSVWEVEAAHIVPHSSKGRDDIWNGLALCRTHHWAFDVGWFTIEDDYTIKISNQMSYLPKDFATIGEVNILNISKDRKLFLPDKKSIYPHKNSLVWHRTNKFFN